MSAGIEAPGVKSLDYASCFLMQAIIGRAQSDCRMNRSSYFKSAAVDQASLYYQPYGNTGFLGFLGYTSFGREQEWVNEVISTFASATIGLSDDDLKYGKLRMKYELANNYTNVSTVADDVGINLLLRGRFQSLDEWGSIFDKITKQNMTDFAMSYLYKKTPACAVIMKYNQPPPPQANVSSSTQQQKPQTPPPQQQQQKSKILSPHDFAN